MSRAVAQTEAVAILRGMLDAPDRVRAIVAVDASTYGPAPFLTDWLGSEAEVTVTFNGGVVVEVASVRIGNRFTNAHGWIEDGNPWDELQDYEAEMLELSLPRMPRQRPATRFPARPVPGSSDS